MDELSTPGQLRSPQSSNLSFEDAYVVEMMSVSSSRKTATELQGRWKMLSTAKDDEEVSLKVLDHNFVTF